MLSANLTVSRIEFRIFKKLEITLTEEQDQHIQEEIKYGGRTLLEEETMGGYELILNVGMPNIYSFLEINYINRIDLGGVEWKFKNEKL